ncbi:alpha/beta fold hydrolase [Rhodoferax aquaticus]|uniref:alpha/beta fold hydrolase n=1 Tax=Rhodoferax aquaticus TaxID=2527691 RepID=UPI00143D0360|nr:alpha/beta hydrolase [Rhodoferax aquaticus]
MQTQLHINGLAVPYLVAGNGEPLILVHGFTANKDTFDAMAPYLTSRYTLYAVDLPGHGDAERDMNADFSMAALVEYVRQFVQALGINRVHLAGSSMGGGVVSFYAASYPNEVASVWLLDAAVTREFLTDSEHIKRYDATGTFPYLIQNHAEHARKLDLVFGKPAKMPHCLKFAFAEAAIRDFAIQSAILQQVRKTIPIDQVYSNLRTPALIVTGDHDLVVPPSSAHTLAKVFPQSTLQVIEGAGHIPMVERPRRCAHDYLQFRTKIAA